MKICDKEIDVTAAYAVAYGEDPEIDYCRETEDAFIFTTPEIRESMSIGPQPTVVLKKGRKLIGFMDYLQSKRDSEPGDDDEVGDDESNNGVIAEYEKNATVPGGWRKVEKGEEQMTCSA